MILTSPSDDSESFIMSLLINNVIKMPEKMAVKASQEVRPMMVHLNDVRRICACPMNRYRSATPMKVDNPVET